MSGTIEARVRNFLLLSVKFYRSFVLVPHEICVVPYGTGKLLLTGTIFNCDAIRPLSVIAMLGTFAILRPIFHVMKNAGRVILEECKGQARKLAEHQSK